MARQSAAKADRERRLLQVVHDWKASTTVWLGRGNDVVMLHNHLLKNYPELALAIGYAGLEGFCSRHHLLAEPPEHLAEKGSISR